MDGTSRLFQGFLPIKVPRVCFHLSTTMSDWEPFCSIGGLAGSLYLPVDSVRKRELDFSSLKLIERLMTNE
jgi:hypothetical protein